jgi:hypothetical protein
MRLLIFFLFQSKTDYAEEHSCLSESLGSGKMYVKALATVGLSVFLLLWSFHCNLNDVFFLHVYCTCGGLCEEGDGKREKLERLYCG